MSDLVHTGAEPPWWILAPFTEGAALGLGWTLESMSPICAGVVEIVLRHQSHGRARVTICRNDGTPVGVAHTDHLDFLLMNGGGGSARTEDSIGRVLLGLAETLRRRGHDVHDKELLAALPLDSEPRRNAVPQFNGELTPLPRPRVDIDALLAELNAADPATVGLGFQPDRGPGHEHLRVLNLRGTGACNSECVFCIEKFNPEHRATATFDATRQLILDSAGQFDMLFFASGEPTIHPRLFDHVELARSVGFTSFGMSSHFRTFADPRFALKTLQAGFEFFDIALHAADAETQSSINPIGDDGQSLFEALKGLGVLNRLAAALGIRISITQKIVISRLNVTRLAPIFRAGYDRGVRHFILQPVRSSGLPPERQTLLAISEEEILPHLNELLRTTAGLDAALKPYGFSRQNLSSGNHVEEEQNRLKNVYGKAWRPQPPPPMQSVREERPTDGRHWVEVRLPLDHSACFASAGTVPVLDEALHRGVDLSFGCRMGSCGMCCARLREGRVDQSNQIFLSDEQIQQGFALLCQARPLSDVVLEVCSEDEIDRL